MNSLFHQQRKKVLHLSSLIEKYKEAEIWITQRVAYIYIYIYFKLVAKPYVCIDAGPSTHFGKRIYSKWWEFHLCSRRSSLMRPNTACFMFSSSFIRYFLCYSYHPGTRLLGKTLLFFWATVDIIRYCVLYVFIAATQFACSTFPENSLSVGKQNSLWSSLYRQWE